MAKTKAERRAAWKARTTESATALKKAKATVTLGGKRSISLKAVTPAQIRVEAWKTKTLGVPIQKPTTRKTQVQSTAHQQELERQRKDFLRIDRNLSRVIKTTDNYKYYGRGTTTPISDIIPPSDVKALKKVPITTQPDEKYIRTIPPSVSVPWYFKLPQNTTKSNMKDAINKGYPGANTTGLTDYQLTTLYENVRGGLHKTKPTPKTPEALDIKLSKEVLDFETWMGDKADDIRGLTVPFGEKGPVKYPQESVARMAELIGGVPASVEKITKQPEQIPTFTAIGLHGMTVGMVKQFKDDPIQTTSDIITTMALFKGAGKARGKVTTTITSARRGKIAPSAIIEEAVLIGERKFPVTKKPGVTPDAAINEFIRSEKNIRTAIETGKVEPPITAKVTGTSKKFLDNVVKTEGEMSAWHATQTGFPKTATAQVGTSSTPGLHVAPSLSPHFLGVGGEAAVFGFRKGGKPTAISIQIEAFQRIPHTSRATSKSMNQFLVENVDAVGPQGVAFITTKFESLAKKSSVEFEAVLPPGTPITRVGKPLETTWQGKKVTVEQYKTVFGDSIKTDIKNITTLEKLYSERAAKKVLISPYDILKAEVSGSSRVARSYRKYSNVFSSSVLSSVSSIKSTISAVAPSYVPYPSPVSRVKPPISFTSYSGAYSSRAASYIRAIETYISRAPALIRPAPVVASTRPKKRIEPTKKKKAKEAMEIKDWFITNPIPTLKSLYGI